MEFVSKFSITMKSLYKSHIADLCSMVHWLKTTGVVIMLWGLKCLQCSFRPRKELIFSQGVNKSFHLNVACCTQNNFILCKSQIMNKETKKLSWVHTPLIELVVMSFLKAPKVFSILIESNNLTSNYMQDYYLLSNSQFCHR